MKRSIFLKFFSGYLLIIVALAILVLLLSFGIIRRFHIESLSQHLENLARSLKWKVTSCIEDQEIEELDAFVKEFGQQINTRITVIDKEGVVLADSDEDPALMENHRFRPEIFRAFGGQTGQSLRFSDTVRSDMLYVGIPIERNGEIDGVLRVSLYLKDIQLLLSRMRSNIFFAAAVIALFSMLGAFLYTRSFSKPIRELSEASLRIASGDFKAKVFLKNRDELGDLASSFNAMSEQIEFMFAELSQKQEELRSILSSIDEGLLSIDHEDKITLFNESLQEIAGTNDIEGKKYWEVIRNPHFGRLIESVRSTKKGCSEELEIDQRVYLASVQYLESRNDVVITLHDVTKSRDVEKMKKDFITNASHELRTPLTAIKGFVETMKGEVEGDQKRYLGIIERNTDRLINMVNDLLVLSEVEERYFTIEISQINLENMISDVFILFENKIKEKKLETKIFSKNRIGVFPGDPFKLEQMFLNIIDNSVKYTEEGQITVVLERMEEGVKIEFQDTGIGISPEHIPRIFERFYVVDKSRSKQLGGTGLGLSIVKHIVLLHGGKIDVESTRGKGTKISVFLPESQ
jgi:two-component system phosphate regulon sensor histidine kinase PhoR